MTTGSRGKRGNDINNGGLAWGITALNSTLANAIRPFSSALTTNQTFQIDMDNGNITTGGSVGFSLENSSAQAVWQYYFTGGSNTYTINAATVSGPAPPNFTRDGMRLTFSLTSPAPIRSAFLRIRGGSAGVGTTTTYTGALLNPGGGQAITSVRLFNFNAGSGTNNNAYFNNTIISASASDNAANSGYSTPGTTFRVWAPNATPCMWKGPGTRSPRRPHRCSRKERQLVRRCSRAPTQCSTSTTFPIPLSAPTLRNRIPKPSRGEFGQ